MPNNVTLKDVAKRAGVAFQTVSKVVNNRHDLVAEKTRLRIEKAIRELDYHRDYLASSMRSGKRNCIGIVGTARMQDINDIVTMATFAGVGQVADEYDNFVTLMPLGTDNIEKKVIKAAKTRIVDGLVIMVYTFNYTRFCTSIAPQLTEAGFPYVAVHATRMDYPCHNVGYDASGAGLQAAGHLREQGVRDIGYVTVGRSDFADEAYKGFIQGLNGTGLQAEKLVLTENYMNDAEVFCREARKRLEQDRIREAYCCFSDTAAYGLIQALEDMGKRVPEDVLVMGMDNLIEKKYLRTVLTSIDCKTYERGTAAARLLFEQIDGKRRPRSKTVILEPELIVRQSSIRTRNA